MKAPTITIDVKNLPEVKAMIENLLTENKSLKSQLATVLPADVVGEVVEVLKSYRAVIIGVENRELKIDIDTKNTIDNLLAKLPSGDGWQPIESAPKDGFGWFLVYNGIVFKAWYNKDSTGKWYHEAVGEQQKSIEIEKPTHWRPLPQPPKALAKLSERKD
jgi:hypothetical protein